MNFKDIVDNKGLEYLNKVVYVGSNPVWDYKAKGNKVYLINEQDTSVLEENVNLQELSKYLYECRIKQDNVIFIDESDGEVLDNHEWTPELNLTFLK